jgi:succinate dehydrogenase/fumarate reductase iron-sulfur protein
MCINGKSRLACETKIEDVNQNGLVEIQPLRHFSIIKDLVSDIEPMITSLTKVVPWLIRDHKTIPEKEYVIQPSQLTSSLQMLDRCILCGICHSDGLDKDESLISPAALVKAFKLMQDPRDIAAFRIKQLIELGILAHPDKWNVTCPKGIDLDNDVLLPFKKIRTIL